MIIQFWTLVTVMLLRNGGAEMSCFVFSMMRKCILVNVGEAKKKRKQRI